eukprot:scaffold8070_cov117-Cylindrotheca_fusiformis.AAC.11
MPSTTLTAIGVTLLGGGCVLLLCIIAFQYALSQQNTNIAPRCSARPPSTICNPWAQQNATAKHPQHRCGGNWVKWVMNLSDETLLRGVPGTGTREDGLQGSLLHVPLDSIVLLRFHALGRKVSLLATVLCIVLLMPLYITTPNPELDSPMSMPSSFNSSSAAATTTTPGSTDDFVNCTDGDSELLSNSTASLCDDKQISSNATMTFTPKPKNHYRQTTLGNVPNLFYFTQNEAYSYLRVSDESIQFRLRAAVLVVWLLTIYTFYLLAEEWSQMVGLRRIWYLEQRRGHSLMRKEATNGDSSLVLESEWHRGFSNDSKSSSSLSPEQRLLSSRPAWIPHPEQPDTVPNIEPYSILLGPLPKPRPIMDDEEVGVDLISFPQQIFLQRIIQQLEDQLPQEPGYTSPICAITLVPTAKDVGPIWMQWYGTMMKLRRMLFIKQQLLLLGHDLQEAENDTTGDACLVSTPPAMQGSTRGSPNGSATSAETTSSASAYMHQVFGGTLLDEEWMQQAQQTMGPEQLAAFSRELAQGASNFCPYGCFEGQVRNANLTTLKELYQLQKEQVDFAKQELHRVQKEFMFRPTIHDSDDEEEELGRHGENDEAEEDSALLLKSRDNHNNKANCDGNRWTAKRGFFTRKRNFAARCLLEKRRHDEEDDEDDDTESAAIEMVSPSTNSPSSRKGTWRIRRSAEWTNGSSSYRVLIQQYYHQLKFQFIELLSKYNHPSSWKPLLAKCWKTWEHEDTFAVVTFTSRQAAAAARQSLSSSGMEVNRLPIPPLADAGAFRIVPFRFFCRPVTVTINSLQKTFRLYM